MHVAAPIRDAGGRIAGVLTVAKPNQAIAPFIERSQQAVLRWGLVLLGTALLVGVLAAWWLSRQVGRLQRYAQAVTAGERVEVPRTAGEFGDLRSEEHTSELQSLMRISYAVFCLKKKQKKQHSMNINNHQ